MYCSNIVTFRLCFCELLLFSQPNVSKIVFTIGLLLNIMSDFVV